jgi:uncharacterized protein (TIGR03663 family)
MTIQSENHDSENSNLWSDKHWIFAIIIVAFGILLRFVDLGDKPYHHDEAIFGMYGFYHFDNPASGYYKYIPMLNGPLLFHLQAKIYKWIGASDFTGRLIPALLGSAMLFIPFIFRKKMNGNLFLFILSLVSFSPVFIYYSRFLRHEYLVLLCYSLFLFAIIQKNQTWKFALLPFLFWLHWCIKENVYVFVAIILGFVIFDKGVALIRKSQESFTSQYLRIQNPNQWLAILMGFSAGFILFYLLYSNFGQYIDGFKDGLYRQSFSYWFNQHSIERIKGPFAIHFMMMNWYELCAFIYILSALGYQIYKYYNSNQKMLLGSFLFLLTASTLLFAPMLLEWSPLRDFFKLKISFDIFLFFFFIFIAIFHTLILTFQNYYLCSFLFYLFISHFFTYSYLGEKVPWLVLYPLFFGLIYATYTFYQEKIWEKYLNWRVNNTFKLSHYLLIVLLGFTITQSIRLNFFRAANIEEFIIQVHPVHAYKNALNRIIETIQTKKPYVLPHILLMEDATWISTWYLKHLRLPTSFNRHDKPLANNDIILSKDPNLPVLDTHNKVEVDYSGWWVPDYNKFNPINFYAYAINHQAWSVSGLMKYYVYTRKGFYEPN